MDTFENAKLQIQQSYSLSDKQTSDALYVLEYAKRLFKKEEEIPQNIILYDSTGTAVFTVKTKNGIPKTVHVGYPVSIWRKYNLHLPIGVVILGSIFVLCALKIKKLKF